MRIKPNKWRIFLIGTALFFSLISSVVYAQSADIKLKAFSDYSLVIQPNGSVWGWGARRSHFSELLKLDNADLTTPTKVEHLKDITDVYNIGDRVFAMKKDGTVWLWSGAISGAWHDKEVKKSVYPIQIKKLKDIVAIADSYFLKSDGNVLELIESDHASYYMLQQVKGLKDILDIKAGGGAKSHFIALKKDGTVWAWGDNQYGQLGGAEGEYREVPVRIKYLKDIIAITAGDNHSLALSSDGTVWGWGNNYFGQLGNGKKDYERGGVQKCKIISGVMAIATDGNFNLALKSEGTTWEWGERTKSQNDRRTNEEKLKPTLINNLNNIKQIATSYWHSLALKNDGSLWVWGDNHEGQLGIGTKYHHSKPVKVADLDNVLAVSASSDRSFALRSDGTVWGWGNIDRDENSYHSVPRKVAKLTDILKISTSYNYSFALKKDKTLWVWEEEGNINTKDKKMGKKSMPYPIDGLKDIIGIARNNKIALKSDGTVWSWKCNKIEQVPGLFNIKALSAYYDSENVALRSDGTVWTMDWLDIDKSAYKRDVDLSSQGVPAVRISALCPKDIIPKLVSGIDNVKVIEVGAGYYLALKSDRTVWTWKSHISAGTKTNVILNSDSVPQLIKEVNPLWAVPTQLTGLTNIIAVAAGRAEYNLSLKSDGTVWAWALNHYNQIENNTSEISNKILPIKIEGLTDIVAITSVRSGYMGYTLFQVHR